MANKGDVDLVIRAKNEASKALDTVSKALDALDKKQSEVGTSANKASSLLDQFAKTVGVVATAYDRLKTDADRAAQSFTRQEASLNENKAAYAAKESRSFEQLILPTEAGAKAIADQVKGGKSLAGAAQSAGLSVSELKDQSREALASAASAAVANAGFAAKQGELVGPLRGSLGWVLLRVTAVSTTPARALAAVRDEMERYCARWEPHVYLTRFSKIEPWFEGFRVIGSRRDGV